MSATLLDLTVDGEPVSIDGVLFMLQSDPYPGGHRYQLIAALPPRLAKIAEDLPGHSLRGAEQRAAFNVIEGWLAGMPREGSPPARFFLNSVDRLGWRSGNLVLEGVCSPVVGADEPDSFGGGGYRDTD